MRHGARFGRACPTLGPAPEGGGSIVGRARALVGTRFRPQGRCPSAGLDCVGTAAIASGIDPARLRRDYPLRGASLAELEGELRGLGLRPVTENVAQAGDVALFAAGAAQLHLAVFTGTGFVHADAGLGKVVERPLPAPWPVLGYWRLEGEA